MVSLGIFLLISGISAPAQPGDFNWEALAGAIVERVDPQPGEKVLLLCHPVSFQPIVPHLREAIVRSGAVDLGCLSVAVSPIQSPDQALIDGWSRSRAALKELLQNVDVTIKLPGALPNAPAYVAIQDNLREGRGRTVHFHWEGAYSPNGAVLQIDRRIDAFYSKALLETDYEAVGRSQREFEEESRNAEIAVTTPAGTDIRFRIGDRPVTRQDGDASAKRAEMARNLIDREIELPCGAIRVAPIEESVSGVIAFPDSDWNGQIVRGLRMWFERGRLTRFEANEGRQAVADELDRGGDSARSFREFALGFNPQLAIPEESPWIPYYGYGAGVVRLSLGDNTELGGQVSGGYVRWNFFIDATVTVGGDTWVRDGRLIK